MGVWKCMAVMGAMSPRPPLVCPESVAVGRDELRRSYTRTSPEAVPAATYTPFTKVTAVSAPRFVSSSLTTFRWS